MNQMTNALLLTYYFLPFFLLALAIIGIQIWAVHAWRKTLAADSANLKAFIQEMIEDSLDTNYASFTEISEAQIESTMVIASRILDDALLKCKKPAKAEDEYISSSEIPVRLDLEIDAEVIRATPMTSAEALLVPDNAEPRPSRTSRLPVPQMKSKKEAQRGK